MFNQNNSGGSFDVDDDVCHRVVIEAADEKQAISIFEPMIENQSDSCPCCGNRWYINPDLIDLAHWKEKGYTATIYKHGSHIDTEQKWRTKYETFSRLCQPSWGKSFAGFDEYGAPLFFNTIEEYSQFMANAYGWTSPDVIIHYLDGSKKQIFIEGK